MSKTPQRYHHGDLRAALVKQAMTALDAAPEAEITLRALAKEVGVSAMAPYAHFADKDALLDAVAAAGFDNLSSRLDSARDMCGAQSAVGDRLLALAKAYVTFGLEHPGLYGIMFGRPAAAPGTPLRDAGEATFERLFDLFPEACADARQEAELAWSMVHGLTLLARTGFIQAGPVLDQRIAAACVALSSGASFPSGELPR